MARPTCYYFMEGDDDSELYEEEEELITILAAAGLVARAQAITESVCYTQLCNDFFVERFLRKFKMTTNKEPQVPMQ